MNPENKIAVWEAHRGGGGGHEMPESCPVAFEYGWLHGGRPEADVNMTVDGVIVSVHDPNLDRIARRIPEHLRGKSISEMTWAEVQSVEVGNDEFPGQRVPSLAMLFSRLKENPERNMILDYKRVPLEILADLIREYGVARQITFASSQRDLLRQMKNMIPEIRTKNWLGGSAVQIMEQFKTMESENFEQITEVQLHLNDSEKRECGGWRYQLSEDFIETALISTMKHGVLLQTLPWNFEKDDLFRILDLGVRSFAVDYPEKFTRYCSEYFGRKWAKYAKQ